MPLSLGELIIILLLMSVISWGIGFRQGKGK